MLRLNKRFHSPKKQTIMKAFASGRGGGLQQPTASAERAAARRRKALAHQSATDPQSTEGFISPRRKHVAKEPQVLLKDKAKTKSNHGTHGNRYDSLSDPEDEDADMELQVSEKVNSRPNVPALKFADSKETSHTSECKQKDKSDQTDQTHLLVTKPSTQSSENSNTSEESDGESSTERSTTSDHSASTASVQNTSSVQTKNLTNTSGNDQQEHNSSSAQEPDDHKENDMEIEKTSEYLSKTANVTEQLNDSVHIDVRKNPVGALAHYEAQLKKFPDPVFSPEVEAQVRAEAAASKERNRIQRAAILREIECDEQTAESQQDSADGKPSATVAGTNKPGNELSETIPQGSVHSVLHSSKVFTPIIVDSSTPDLTTKNTHNPYLGRSISNKQELTKGNPIQKPPFQAKSHHDKPILLKKGAQRQHIHRYDLCLIIKSLKKDEDEEVRIQKTLQRFLDTMLRADPSTLIPPYLELE